MTGKFKPWEVLSSREVYSARPWVTLSVQKVKLPSGRIIDEYHQVTFADYAVVFAQTPTGDVVVERIYKHGVGRAVLALPAGIIEADEEPLTTAKRELLEETGYDSDDWRPLGSFVLNGNYGCGKAYLFMARGAHQVAEPDSGDLEEMEIIAMKLGELLYAARTGEIALLGSMAAIAIATNPLLIDPVQSAAPQDHTGNNADGGWLLP